MYNFLGLFYDAVIIWKWYSVNSIIDGEHWIEMELKISGLGLN